MEEKNKNLKNKINIYILYKLLRDFFWLSWPIFDFKNQVFSKLLAKANS